MADIGAASVLVAVVDAGSFSAAAQHLGVTKSAVSKRISRLEEQLGVRLLLRTTRKLALTEAGERFYLHASQAVAAAREAERAATALQQRPQGLLRVISLMAFGHLHLAPLLPEFARRYPEVQLDLILDDRSGRLFEGDFDVAVRAGDLPSSSMITRTLAPLTSVICASPAYLQHCDTPRKPSDLRAHNCLIYSYSHLPSRWTFQRHGRSQSIEVAGTLSVNNGEALCQIVLGGAGVSRLPRFIAAPYITSGQLVPLLTDYTMPSKSLLAVYPERRYLPQKVRVFIDYMIEAFGGATPPWDRPDFDGYKSRLSPAPVDTAPVGAEDDTAGVELQP